MTRAILVPFHKYTPFGGEYYEPMLDFFLENIKKYKDEFDTLYLIDSDWGIPESPEYTVFKREISGHHWIQYKWAIPKIKEELILFMDNDAIIFRKGIIDNWFKQLEIHDACVVFDGTGGLKDGSWEVFPLLKEKGAEKIGSWYFAVTKKMLNKIGDIDMEPHQYKEGEYIKEINYYTKKGDWCDSFGIFLLQLMVNEAKLFEIEDDKNRIYFGGDQLSDTQVQSKQLGYAHVFAGSSTAYLLATRKYGNMDTYWEYLNNQPQQEYLRQMAWYFHMGGNVDGILEDIGMDLRRWSKYIVEFYEFHGLER